MYCTNCGHNNQQGLEFCIKCRHPLKKSPDEPEPLSFDKLPKGQRQHPKKALVIILITSALVLILTVALIILVVNGIGPFNVTKPISPDSFFIRYSTSSDYEVISGDYGHMKLIASDSICYKAYNKDVSFWFYEFSSEDIAKSKIQALLSSENTGETDTLSLRNWSIKEKAHYQFIQGTVNQPEENIYLTSEPEAYVVRIDNTILIAQANIIIDSPIPLNSDSNSEYQLYMDPYPHEYSVANTTLKSELSEIGYWFD